MTPSRPSLIAALGVLLRSPPLRLAAFKRLRAPALTFLSQSLAVFLAVLILGSCVSFFVWASHPTGRFLQLQLNLYKGDGGVFYTVDQRLASDENWSLAVKTLKLERVQSTFQYSLRSAFSQAHGLSIFGLSAAERSELLSKSAEWLAKAKEQEALRTQALRDLLQQSSHSAALSAEPLLAASSALARLPERQAVEIVRKAVLQARPMDPLSISARSRFGASWAPSDSPSIRAAFAESQSLESEGIGWAMIGAFAWLSPILFSLLVWGLIRWIRAKTQNLSPELLLEWERQSVAKVAGRATAAARSRRL